MGILMNLLMILTFSSIGTNQVVKENYGTSCVSLVIVEKGKALVVAKHHHTIFVGLCRLLQKFEHHFVKGGVPI